MATAAAAARKSEISEYTFRWVGQDRAGKTARESEQKTNDKSHSLTS